ncbi:MAG: hypothetical protein KDJ36_00175 [Hyphomicrobiaceae bacterium]|nr:hypothetical protein [Hyphomicrobiaceae bacterium]
MTEEERREVAEARQFLDEMCHAYHEQVRRKAAGEPSINLTGVLGMYTDVTHYRNRIIAIGVDCMERGVEGPDALISTDLVRTWKALMATFQSKTYDYVPPRPQ